MIYFLKEAPYVMKKEPVNNQTLVGNDKYKGYCVDLLEKISKICGFNYTIKLVEDGLHGAFVNGKWNGIVNELIEKVKIIIQILEIHKPLFVFFQI